MLLQERPFPNTQQYSALTWTPSPHLSSRRCKDQPRCPYLLAEFSIIPLLLLTRVSGVPCVSTAFTDGTRLPSFFWEFSSFFHCTLRQQLVDLLGEENSTSLMSLPSRANGQPWKMLQMLQLLCSSNYHGTPFQKEHQGREDVRN